MTATVEQTPGYRGKKALKAEMIARREARLQKGRQVQELWLSGYTLRQAAAAVSAPLATAVRWRDEAVMSDAEAMPVELRMKLVARLERISRGHMPAAAGIGEPRDAEAARLVLRCTREVGLLMGAYPEAGADLTLHVTHDLGDLGRLEQALDAHLAQREREREYLDAASEVVLPPLAPELNGKTGKTDGGKTGKTEGQR